MKNRSARGCFLLLICLCLSGCNAVGSKSLSLAWIYAGAALVSLVLLISCAASVRENRVWFLLLFSSVLVVNAGYTLLAFSTSLNLALMANRISYLGSVFLPLSMLMIILEVTRTPFRKRLPVGLSLLAAVVFLIAASPGILDIYYQDVSLEITDGVARLNKVYGPLHPVYLIYLLGYFTSMVAVIFRARRKKNIDTAVHAVILATAVLVNIGVWLVEQLTHIDFEFLSLSYIISELFLLGAHRMMTEYRNLQAFIKKAEESCAAQPEQSYTDRMLESPLETDTIDPTRVEAFMHGLSRLTPTEKVIYEAYTARVTSKEIMANLNIKENTLKYHNRNLYGKLCISSRKELLEIYKYLKSVNVKSGENA